MIDQCHRHTSVEFKLKFGDLQKKSQIHQIKYMYLTQYSRHIINCPVGYHGAILICSVEHTISLRVWLEASLYITMSNLSTLSSRSSRCFHATNTILCYAAGVYSHTH